MGPLKDKEGLSHWRVWNGNVWKFTLPILVSDNYFRTDKKGKYDTLPILVSDNYFGTDKKGKVWYFNGMEGAL